MENIKILIIDDNPLFCLLTKTALADSSYEIFEASSAQQGLEIIEQIHPNLVITDVLMPIMDGYEFLRRLRSLPIGQSVKVIFYTGTFSNFDEQTLAKSGGVLSFLIKPAEPADIRQTVKSALSTSSGPPPTLSESFNHEHLRILTNRLSEQVRNLEKSNDDLSIEMERRRHAEQEAVKARIGFQTLIDSIPQLTWRLCQNGLIEYTNERWRKYHNVTDEKLSLEQWCLFIHPLDRNRVFQKIQKSIGQLESFQFEARLLNSQNPTFVPHLISGLIVKNSANDTSTWICTATDISVQKNYEMQLIQLKDQAESLSRAKTEFLRNISHEIRTPLTAILGFSELLIETHSELKNDRYMERITYSTGHLTSILNDLIAIAEIETEGSSSPMAPFSIQNLFRGIKNTFEDRLKEKSLDLFFNLDTPADQDYRSYPETIDKIMHYLIDNAIKFTDTGSVTMHSSIQNKDTMKNGTTLILEVEDTGIGITAEDQKLLFQMFSQVDGSTTRKYGGLGLGLLLSKKLAETIDGRLELVRSIPGKGSCFRLSVPMFESSLHQGVHLAIQ